MVRSIVVNLSEEVRRALLMLAQAERRRPQDQAALLITDALARSGFLEVVRPADPEPARRPR